MKAVTLLADGCEELEAVTIIDILRRAGVEVAAAGLKDELICCSRGIRLMPDMGIDDIHPGDYDMVILPGGMPGAEHLRDDQRVINLLQHMNKNQKYIAAICAAPMVLHAAGLLEGKKATSFPGVLDKLPDSHTYITQPVVVDGNLVTSRGPGTAMDFALTLIEVLCGKARRTEVEAPLQRA
jgi:4-methyl-5(b-hydroxyethyl)-thiazole monophosphate biosynthesis